MGARGLTRRRKNRYKRNLAQAITLKHQLGDMTPSERGKIEGMMRDTRRTIAMLEEVLRMAEREEAVRSRDEAHAATRAGVCTPCEPQATPASHAKE